MFLTNSEEIFKKSEENVKKLYRIFTNYLENIFKAICRCFIDILKKNLRIWQVKNKKKIIYFQNILNIF